MHVLVKLFAEFREAAGQDRQSLELPDGATVKDALRELAHREPALSELMFSDGRLHDHLHVFVNGRNVGTTGGLESGLSDGDTLTFFPPVGGG